MLCVISYSNLGQQQFLTHLVFGKTGLFYTHHFHYCNFFLLAPCAECAVVLYTDPWSWRWLSWLSCPDLGSLIL